MLYAWETRVPTMAVLAFFIFIPVWPQLYKWGQPAGRDITTFMSHVHVKIVGSEIPVLCNVTHTLNAYFTCTLRDRG